jgi:hypothetical protein
MQKSVDYYLDLFQSMKCNKHQGKVAPHKAIMLLTVMNDVANGIIKDGFIPHNEMMVRRYKQTWDKYVVQSPFFKPVFATPFYHLSNEPFWKLMKTDEYVERKEYSLPALRKCFFGAKIEDELCKEFENDNSLFRLAKALFIRINPDDNSFDANDMAYRFYAENTRQRYELQQHGNMPKNLEFCKYYHGESQMPNALRDTVAEHFWYGEMMFVQDSFDMDEWKSYAKAKEKYIKEEKKKKYFSYPPEQRAILFFISELFAKWCPYDDQSWLLDY